MQKKICIHWYFKSQDYTKKNIVYVEEVLVGMLICKKNVIMLIDLFHLHSATARTQYFILFLFFARRYVL